MSPALVDTGPLVALYNERDQHHATCREAARQLPRGLVTCWPVLTEAAWLLRGDPPALRKLLSDFERGTYVLAPLGLEALPWIGRFLDKYTDLPAQFADAALMYLADRERLSTVFTTDRRDFSVYRTSDGTQLRIIP